MSAKPNRKPGIIIGVLGFLALLACATCVAIFFVVWNLPSSGGDVLDSKTILQPVVAISSENMDKVERLGAFSQRTAIRSMAWSPDSRVLAVGGNPTPDQRRSDRIEPIKLWNVAPSAEGRSLQGPQSAKPLAESQQFENVDAVNDVTFSPDGRWLAATYTYGIKIWNVADGQPAQTINLWHTNLGQVNFTPDGQAVFTRVREYQGCTGVQSWDVVSGRPLRCDKDGLITWQGKTFVWKNTQWFDVETARSVGAFRTVAVSHDGKVLAHRSNPITAESVQATLTLTELTNGKILGQWNKFHYHSSVAFSANDTLVVAQRVSEGFFSPAPITLWDVSSGKMRELDVHTTNNIIVFSPDGRFLAIGGSGQVELWGIKP